MGSRNAIWTVVSDGLCPCTSRIPGTRWLYCLISVAVPPGTRWLCCLLSVAVPPLMEALSSSDLAGELPDLWLVLLSLVFDCGASVLGSPLHCMFDGEDCFTLCAQSVTRVLGMPSTISWSGQSACLEFLVVWHL